MQFSPRNFTNVAEIKRKRKIHEFRRKLGRNLPKKNLTLNLTLERIKYFRIRTLLKIKVITDIEFELNRKGYFNNHNKK